MNLTLRRACVAVCAAAAVATSLLAVSAGAQAGIALPHVVSETPAAYTPNLVSTQQISHPAAYAIAAAPNGATMYVGGQFSAVANVNGLPQPRANIAAFNTSTGKLTSFAPDINGNVWAIVPIGGYVYVAGEFSAVDGVSRLGVAKLTTSGAVVSTWNAPWSRGKAYDMKLVGGRLVLGGNFPGALLALNQTNGANTKFLSLGISGSEPNGGLTKVYRFAVSPDGSRLVAIGNFLKPHTRAFMVNMTTGTVADWYYQPLADDCKLPVKLPAPLRGVDFSPDGSYFVIVATGGVATQGNIGKDVCDAAARFNTNMPNPTRPVWINYTGGDTLHSVTVSSTAVYVQGHNRWLDNPQGHDTCLTTCVSRPGIGAIDPDSGRALSWNPTKTRGVGGKALLLTPKGLWVMSDTQTIGHRHHYGIALLPEN